MASYMKWKEAGIIAASNVSEKGDILKSCALTSAQEMGATV
jgi:hypothetical protein